MIKGFAHGVVGALMTSDTPTAISLLQENTATLSDPFAGANLMAEFLYFAIKKANREVIRCLTNLKTGGGLDIPFYNYCGDTPIGLALKEGLQEIIPNLLPMSDKNFALLTAVKLKNKTLIDFLLNSFPFKEKLLNYLDLKKA